MIEGNKKLSPIVTELFMRVRKLNISLVSLLQSYFMVPEDIILNVAHYFIIKIPERQHIASNHLSDIECKDFMKLYKNYTKEPFPFLVNNTNLLLSNPLKFRKNFFEK